MFGDCDFVVTWETALACPVQPAGFFTFIFWAIVIFGAYLLGGFIYNVR